MDQKKTLWIAIAAGLFLLVVIGAALFLCEPAAKRETTVATLNGNNAYLPQEKTPTVPADNLAQGTAAPATSVLPPANNSEPSATSPEVTAADTVTVIANGPTTVIGLGDNTNGETTTIDLNTLKTTPTSITPQNKAAETAMSQANVTYEKATVTPPVKAEPVKKATTTVKKTTAAPAKKASVAKIPDSFWVQVSSYTTKKNADEARSALDENKIPCEVFTYKDSKGNLFYRVRVGPYTTKSEAEYWKNRIEAIDLFAKSGSYITNSSAAKR